MQDMNTPDPINLHDANGSFDPNAKRSSIFPDPKFQALYLIICGIIYVGTASVWYATYFLFKWPQILCALFTVSTFYTCHLLVSFRIAGPIHSLKTNMKNYLAGEKKKLAFREHDFFSELINPYNEIIGFNEESLKIVEDPQNSTEDKKAA